MSSLLEDFKHYTVQRFLIKHILKRGWVVPAHHIHNLKELKKKQSSSVLLEDAVLAADKLKIIQYVAKQGKYLPDDQNKSGEHIEIDECWVVCDKMLLSKDHDDVALTFSDDSINWVSKTKMKSIMKDYRKVHKLVVAVYQTDFSKRTWYTLDVEVSCELLSDLYYFIRQDNRDSLFKYLSNNREQLTGKNMNEFIFQRKNSKRTTSN